MYFMDTFMADRPTMNFRGIGWICWRYKLGYYHAGSTWYMSNPWEVPWRNPAHRYRYGPAVYIYPNPEYPQKIEPVNTIRWELLREGIEDYEYLWLLRDRIRKVEKVAEKMGEKRYKKYLTSAKDVLGKATQLGEKVLNENYLAIPSRLKPTEVYKMREEIAIEIQNLNTILREKNIQKE